MKMVGILNILKFGVHSIFPSYLKTIFLYIGLSYKNALVQEKKSFSEFCPEAR